MYRFLLVPVLAAAVLSLPLAAQAQAPLDPTTQALLGGTAHTGSASAPTLSPTNAATMSNGASVAEQTTSPYYGNKATGFGGTLGNGSLSINSTAPTSTTDGNITFTFNPSGGFTGNTVVIYIDSKTGGIANTSNLSDTGDNGRRAVSGEQNSGDPNIHNGTNSRTQVNFAPDFSADYAIAFDNTGFNNAFGLPTDTSALPFVATQKANTGANGADSITVSYAQLGLTPGGSFNFVGTYLDGTSAYRSNETIGTSSTTVGDNGGNGNAGYTGTQTFSSFDTYTTDPLPAPEPGGVIPLVIGAAALGGLILVRRRRALPAA